MENKQYYTFEGRVKHGPMSAQEVLGRFSKLSAGEEMMVWTSDFNDWKPVKDCLKQLEHAAAKEKSCSKAPRISPLTRIKFVVLAALGKANARFLKISRARRIAISASVVVIVAATCYLFIGSRTVSGQVLIVQGDAQVRKLALVHVRIYKKATASGWAADVHPKVEKIKAEAFQYLDEVSKDTVNTQSLVVDDFPGEVVPKARRIALLGQSAHLVNLYIRNANEGYSANAAKQLNDINENYRDLLERRYGYAKGAQVVARDCPAIVDKTKKELDSLYDYAAGFEDGGIRMVTQRYQDVDRVIQEYRSNIGTLLYEPDPALVAVYATAMSDGDGLFSVSLPPGQYVAMAVYSRSTIGGTENYRWAVNFSVGFGGGNTLILGNQNIEGSSPLCLWTAEFLTQSDEPAKALAKCSEDCREIVQRLQAHEVSKDVYRAKRGFEDFLK